MIEWQQVAVGLFGFGWSCIFVYVAKTLNKLTESVAELNTNVAVLLEKTDGHEKRITRLEENE